MPGRLVVWGAGGVGSRVATRWVQRGGEAIGYTKTRRRHRLLAEAGVEPRMGSPLEDLRPTDLLLLSLPGIAAQRRAVDQLRDGGVPCPRRTVFASSTVVYARPPGAVLDAHGPLRETARAREALAAEAAFSAWAGTRGVILRLGGLYAPGRGLFARLRRHRIPPPWIEGGPLLLIHYDDAAQAVLAALSHVAPQPVYLVAAPDPPTRDEFFEAACRRLGIEYIAPLAVDGRRRQRPRLDLSSTRRDLLPRFVYPHWHAALG